ncbi:hypothetical protein, partial [Lentzea aerocolonigenes]|uniref:hypothetical protein n=1 Tax=Lentzea aerocolonigenes TaxID=68170 RepID=UPI001E477F0D
DHELVAGGVISKRLRLPLTTTISRSPAAHTRREQLRPATTGWKRLTSNGAAPTSGGGTVVIPLPDRLRSCVESLSFASGTICSYDFGCLGVGIIAVSMVTVVGFGLG